MVDFKANQGNTLEVIEKMGLLKYGSGIFVTLSLMFGAVSLPPAKAQDNRFIKISDLSGFHTEYVITPGIAQ